MTYVYPRMGPMLEQGRIHVNVKLREVTLTAIKLKGTFRQSTQIVKKYSKMERTIMYLSVLIVSSAKL